MTTLIVFSAGPVVVFACVTGISLGVMVAIAAVIIFILQSIVLGIAGAILLFILASIFVLTAIAFGAILAGHAGFKILRDIAVYIHGHHQEHIQRKQQEQNQQQDSQSFDLLLGEKIKLKD